MHSKLNKPAFARGNSIWRLQPDREQFVPVMESFWKTYPPVYLYYPKNAGKTKRVKALIDFLISATER